MKTKGNIHLNNSQYLLALHSSSNSFGVALLDINNPEQSKKSATFPIGRTLSNQLFNCVTTVLEKRYWKKIHRLAVAVGPGSYTGTRITVAMARTMAQQLECSLDSFSSFELMASRLSLKLDKSYRYEPFWITEILKRRGIVAGKYQIIKNSIGLQRNLAVELKAPYLLNQNEEISPSINASNNIESDIVELLNLSYLQQLRGITNSWQNVLPLYPSSPLDKV